MFRTCVMCTFSFCTHVSCPICTRRLSVVTVAKLSQIRCSTAATAGQITCPNISSMLFFLRIFQKSPAKNTSCAKNVLRCGAVRCSAMQCVAMRCGALECVAVRCSVLQCDAVRCSALQYEAVRCSTLQCVAVHCSTLQCVAVRCSVLQCVVSST